MRSTARVVAGVVALGVGMLTLEGAALVGLSHSGSVSALPTLRALQHATTIVARTSTVVVQRMLVDRLGDGMLGAVCWSRDVLASIAPVIAAPPEPCRDEAAIGDLVAASVIGRIGAQCGHSVVIRRVRTNPRTRVLVIERDGVRRVIRDVEWAPKARPARSVSS